MLDPCQAGEYDGNGFCWRSITVMIVTDGACTLDHTFTWSTITVDCAEAYSGSDCPLFAPDTSSSASFTVLAADYCDGQRALVINGAIVIQAYVPQRTLNRNDHTSVMRAYVVDQYAWLTLFIDAAQSLKVYAMHVLDDGTGTGFQTKIAGGSYTTPPDAGQYIQNVNDQLSNGGPGNDVTQGFDVDTQTHAMWVQLQCNFVVDGSGDCLVNPGGAVPRLEIFARLIFYVDYEAADTRRRRRQVSNEQAAQTDRGYAAMDTNASVEANQEMAAEIPSAASGVRPAAALALAVATAALALWHANHTVLSWHVGPPA